MKMRTAALSGLLLLFFALVGCGRAATDQPPEIFYGEQICEECGMIISEPRFAAAYYTSDGDSRRFDDIGGMCSYHLEHDENVDSFWVHDYDSEEWLAAESAVFVMGAEIHTPMDFGVVAFSDSARAQSFALEKDAMILTFEDVMGHYRSAPDAAEHDHEGN